MGRGETKDSRIKDSGFRALKGRIKDQGASFMGDKSAIEWTDATWPEGREELGHE